MLCHVIGDVGRYGRGSLYMCFMFSYICTVLFVLCVCFLVVCIVFVMYWYVCLWKTMFVMCLYVCLWMHGITHVKIDIISSKHYALHSVDTLNGR
jgi:hypothetical protein